MINGKKKNSSSTITYFTYKKKARETKSTLKIKRLKGYCTRRNSIFDSNYDLIALFVLLIEMVDNRDTGLVKAF